MTTQPTASDRPGTGAMNLDAPTDFVSVVDERRAALDRADFVRRLWKRDPSLWPGGRKQRPLGFLGRIAAEQERHRRYAFLRRTVRDRGVDRVLWLGMGGASLFAEVASRTLRGEEGVALTVVDTTDPTALRSVARDVDPGRTLAVVASKSGTTLETTLLEAWATSLLEPAGDPRRRLAYVTDPGSPMDRRAREAGVFAVFPGERDVGGRFSATTDFGLVPAALAGADVGALLDAAAPMEAACRVGKVSANPGADLGAVLAAAEAAERRYLTILPDEPWRPLCAWIEQLVAESTGKAGRGLLPLWDEPQGEAILGEDRLVVRLVGERPSEVQDALAAEARAAGTPVVTIRAGAAQERVLAEVVRWQVAVATCGHLMEIDPFDQPDVEATKAATRRMLEGEVLRPEPDFVGDGFEVRGDVPAAAPRLVGALATLAGAVRRGDYLAVLAYLPPTAELADALGRLRAEFRAARGIAVAGGWGPRYLHASGQFHKGGPACGAFLVLTHQAGEDVPVPGRDVTFGAVERAQAAADAAVLRERGRPVLEIEIQAGEDLIEAVGRLAAACRKALRGA
ncbi:MAG: hypothetical protein D6705_08030 [Deltaproteobacteria bacterium]|nr:MAG: hypothetical protein D6705_08030 [Deltaproteobacteria bacterium]